MLVDSDQRIALMWSPKSGCTFTTKWFFSQAGVLEEAVGYHPWVHRYRKARFEPSPRQRAAVTDLLARPEVYRKIKVVRHPLARAVSAYVAANIHAFADMRMGTVLGRSLDRDHRFSFGEFVDYLETLDLRTCGQHVQVQAQPLEYEADVRPDFVIDLHDAIARLGALEQTLGLKRTDVASFAQSGHHTHRRVVDGFFGDHRFVLGHGERVPTVASFYNDALATRVEDIYLEDFERYGYHRSLAMLQTRPSGPSAT